MDPKHIWVVLLVLAFSGCALCSSEQTDAAALLSLKKSVEKDPSGILQGWDSSHDPCFWHGVRCTYWRVTEVDLSGARLVGILPASFSSLDKLQLLNLSANSFTGNAFSLIKLPLGLRLLDLSFNQITGSIPAEFLTTHPKLSFLSLSHNNLTGLDVFHSDQLQILDLSFNNLSGVISGPDKFTGCYSLVSLDLSSNMLTGYIPSSFSSCLALQAVNLSSNQLEGGIPGSLGELTSLQLLDLSHNHLRGAIPSELGNCCQSLTVLQLSSNNLSGSIPSSFSTCSALQVLNLENNNISGLFPDSILGNLNALESLLLSNNYVSGPFPPSISSCKKLKVVDFSSNKLSGSLPHSICPGAEALEELMLPDNLISGQIPVTLAFCPQLKTIDLSLNFLKGSIPPELGRLSNLERLMMWFNGLEGRIPPELGKCSQLKNLILNNNYLTGEMPQHLANCSNLEWISLTSNKISGRIPRQFGKLSRLAILQLANNSFSGDIPQELGSCSSLLWLDLNSNNLSGTIPKHLGRRGGLALSGILSGNTLAFVRNIGSFCKGVGGLLEFAGIRPERLLQVPTLKTCDFTRLYSGSALNDWTHYVSLEYLDLSYNNLQGSIPSEFSEMVALQVLGLAHNKLSGTLPESLGHLTNLGVFDAAHNKLQGNIPESFSNLTFLVQIDLSNNDLVGPIPSRGQLSTLPASQYANNPGLCGVPLASCSASFPGNNNITDNTNIQNFKRPAAASWANSIVLGILISMASVCVLIVWAITMRARQKEGEAAAILNTLYNSGNITTWKIGKEKEPLSINVATFERPLRKLTFSQLIEATNGFCAESLIGSGGFGEVFKASLRDGSVVAIKKLIRLSYQGDREFMAEMETLGKIKHRNLVPLLGYCKVGEERLLVYEYMEYGSLEDMLHGDKAKTLLTWDVRKQIARGAAKGLAFLHHNCIPHIIHRDMKSSNVLLDKNMEARVSDFGMARLISALDTHLSVSTLAGTPGYVPPEYYQSFRCTAKGDVYSFGVLLLEILTGKRPTDKEEFGDSNLVGWVKLHLNQGKAEEVIDPDLKDIGADSEVLRYLQITMQCLEDFPSRRPSMMQVVSMFKELHVRAGGS
ncbi:hypothetical protein SUGI_0982550 [Cryptomeria japonica]|uniref:serine/threonine-protein kinase BRI1-like 2 n=1 Tax=Cryptomeria japonica TaxID=3369 RepID=UPI002414B498|nr:serine/threonine-protein kinase BRI1-like 2 [Cryptomeria japonica]GLJ46628.1 hypothetical protein SUGI_0982550 [Cryptomeria japonica]